jgi:hypothetical protein
MVAVNSSTSGLKYDYGIDPDTGREFGYESRNVAIVDPTPGGKTTYYYRSKSGKSIRKEMPGNFSSTEETKSYGKLLQDIELGKSKDQAVTEHIVRTDTALKERDARAVIQTGKVKEITQDTKSILYVGKDNTKASSNTLDVTKDPYGRFGFTPQVAFANASGSSLTIEKPKQDNITTPKQKGWIESGKEVITEDIFPIFTGAGKVIYSEAQKKTGIKFDPLPKFQASKEDYIRTGVVTGLGVTAVLAPPLAETAFTYMKVGQSVEFAVNPTKKEAIRTALFFTPDVIKVGKGIKREVSFFKDFRTSPTTNPNPATIFEKGLVVQEKQMGAFEYGTKRIPQIIVQNTPDIIGKTVQVYKEGKAGVLQTKTDIDIFSRYLNRSPLEPGYVEPPKPKPIQISRSNDFNLKVMPLEVQKADGTVIFRTSVKPKGQINLFGKTSEFEPKLTEEFAPKDFAASRDKKLIRWGFQDPMVTTGGVDLRGRLQVTYPEPIQTKIPTIEVVSNKKASGKAKAMWLENINKQQSEALGKIAKESYKFKKNTVEEMFNLPEVTKNEQTSISLRPEVREQGTLDMITNKGSTKFIPPEEVIRPREPITKRPAIAPGLPRVGVKEGIGNINLPSQDIFSFNIQRVGKDSNRVQEGARKFINDDAIKNIQDNIIDTNKDVFRPQDVNVGRRSIQSQKQRKDFLYIQRPELKLEKPNLPPESYKLNFKYKAPKKSDMTFPSFKLENTIRSKKSRSKKFKGSFVRQINPSIEASFFNIKSNKVNMLAANTGLGTIAIKVKR